MTNTNHTTKRILLLAGFSNSLLNFRGPLIKALCDSGLEVHAAAPQLTSNSGVTNKLKEWGVTCHDVSLHRAGINPISDVRGLLEIFRLMRLLDVDLVLGYTIKPVIYGTLAAWLANVPKRFALITGLGYAFSDTSSVKGRIVQIMARRLYALALSRADLVFVQNPDDQTLLRRLNIIPKGVASAVLNGSGIDLSKFNFLPVPKEPVVFLLIARLLGAKGVREYVDAARQIKDIYSSVVFRLVGNLDDNPDSVCAAELEQWQEKGVIEYLGHLEDVRPAIANASVYVLPTYYPEGTPRTVLEAMAMGRAVITTDSPGCRETVINGYNGFLVPVKSVDELAKAMRTFIDTPELIPQMGKRSRKIAEEKYDVHKVNRVMLDSMGITS